jgi:hypothetical protein
MRILFQFNLVKMRAPFSDSLFDDFKAWIPALHALAQVHPGFVWRYEGEKDEDGYIKPYPDAPLIMGNMSAWKDYHSLYDYTFSSSHLEMMKDKRKWFEKMSTPYSVLYYGEEEDLLRPPLELLEEAKKRLSYFSVYSETPVAFNFGSHNGVL